MPHPVRPRLVFAGLLLAVVTALLVAVPASADSITFPNPVSPNGQRINDLYLLISIPAILVFVFVEGWILLVILRYRRSRLPAGYVPPQWHGNRLLEVAWTLIPLIIVLAIAALSFGELQRDFVVPTNAATQLDVTVEGYQFGWDYKYPQGFKSTEKLVVPVNKLVRLRVRTRDVIHSWWVPAITGKTDAVPGYDNFTWLDINQVGTWHGECAELCGTGHYSMATDVQAMTQSDYDNWVQQQLAKAQPSPSPSSSPSSSPPASPAGSPAPPASPAASPSP